MQLARSSLGSVPLAGRAVPVVMSVSVAAVSSSGAPVLVNQANKIVSAVATGNQPIVSREPRLVVSLSSANVPVVVHEPRLVVLASTSNAPSVAIGLLQFLVINTVVTAVVPAVVRSVSRGVTATTANIATFTRSLLQLLTVPATASGVPTVVKTSSIGLQTNAAGVSSFVKLVQLVRMPVSNALASVSKRVARTFSLEALGAPSMLKLAIVVLELVVTTGNAVLVKLPARILVVSVTGLSSVQRHVMAFWSATALGLSALIRMGLLGPLSVGSACVSSIVKSVAAHWSATGAGTAEVIRQPGRIVTAATAGEPSLTKLAGVVITAIVSGNPELVRQAQPVIRADATGLPSMIRNITRAVGLVVSAEVATVKKDVSMFMARVDSANIPTVLVSPMRIIVATVTGTAFLLRAAWKVVALATQAVPSFVTLNIRRVRLPSSVRLDSDGTTRVKMK